MQVLLTKSLFYGPNKYACTGITTQTQKTFSLNKIAQVPTTTEPGPMHAHSTISHTYMHAAIYNGKMVLNMIPYIGFEGKSKHRQKTIDTAVSLITRGTIMLKNLPYTFQIFLFNT
jgi:hypothetical protein